ncbi:hypothetical protein ABZ609_30240 [Streptomyces rubiginosohelvolus]
MAEGAGASATLTWLAIVTLVALVSWYQPSLSCTGSIPEAISKN